MQINYIFIIIIDIDSDALAQLISRNLGPLLIFAAVELMNVVGKYTSCNSSEDKGRYACGC